MNEQIRQFLDHLDEALTPSERGEERFNLYLLGRSALALHYEVVLAMATSDIDMVLLEDSPFERKALEMLGKGTAMAEALGLYLDPVPQGLPPLPRWFRQRAVLVPGPWRVLRLWKLEVHDLATTKLKSFRAKDRQDLQALCDLGLLNIGQLRASLDAAFPFRSPKDEGEDIDNPDWIRASASLARVEDYLRGKIGSI